MGNLAEIVNIDEARPIVKADIENGYVRLANDLTQALMLNQANLSAREMQVVFAIISKTFGFNKKEDWITNSQICELTGLNKGHVSNLIKSLINKKVIYINGRKKGVNCILSDWKVHKLVNNKSSQPSEQKFTNSCTGVHKDVNKSSQIRETQKKDNTTKDNTTKYIGAKRKKPASQLPENFHVDQTMIIWAKDNQINVDLTTETEQFKDFHSAKDSRFVDWRKAWQTWMRNSKKFSKNSNQKSNTEKFNDRDYGQAVVRF